MRRVIRSLLSLFLCFATVFTVAATTASFAAGATQAQTDAVIDAIQSYVVKNKNVATKGYYGKANGCCAFVNHVWKNVFGIDIYTPNAHHGDHMDWCTSSGELYNFLLKNNARAGDVLQVCCSQCGSCGKEHTHWMIIASFDQKGITVYDSKGNGMLWHCGGAASWNNSYYAQHYWNGNSKNRGINGFYVGLIQANDNWWLKATTKGNSKGPTPTAKVQDGLYTLTPACAPNSRLDIQGKSTSNGANAHIWKAYDDTSQIFSITAEGDGYYLITSDHTGKRLDVTNAKTSSGTNVQQWSANDNAAQRWAFEDAGDGYYYIVSKLASDLCLDVSDGDSANGTNVQVWSKNNTASQKWKLTPVEKEPKLVTITFDSNGGGAEYSWTREVGGTYGPQPDIIRDGYTLDGWYTARQGGKKVLPLTKIDSEDEQITLYAHWTKEEPKLVTITVDFNGGDGAGVCWRREVGETYGSLPDATRDGYIFDGWYTSRRGGERVTSSTRIDGKDGEITLYARWTKEESEVPPTYEPIKIPNVIPSHEPVEEPEVPSTPEPIVEPEVPSTPKPVDPPTPQTPEEPKGHWGPWSDWSEKKANASNTRQVERREVEDTPAYTEYRYGKWGNPRTKQGHACKNLAQQYYGSVVELTTEWYSTRYSAEKDYKIFCGGKNHTHKGCFKQDGNDVWNRYIVDGVTYFWEESREVKATYKTQYRYRDWIED